LSAFFNKELKGVIVLNNTLLQKICTQNNYKELQSHLDKLHILSKRFEHLEILLRENNNDDEKED